MTTEQAREHFARSERFSDEGTVRAMLSALGFTSEPPAPDAAGGWTRAALSQWMATAQRSRVVLRISTR